MKKLVIISLLFVAVACGRKGDCIKSVELPTPIGLTATKVDSKVDLLMAAKNFVHKDKLIVFEPLNNDIFKVYDLKTLEHLYSFGNRGRASNEIVSSLVHSDIIVSDPVEIYDAGIIKTIDFKDTTASIVNIKPLPVAHLKNPVNRLHKITDSVYYFDNFFEEGNQNEFTKMDLSSRDFTSFGTYPKWGSDKLSDTEKFITYAKSTTYNKRQHKIAAFYYLFPVLKIMDATTGETLSETHIELPGFSFKNPDPEKIIFGEPVSTDNYIYALWMNSEKSKLGVSGDDFKPAVLVFDWDGNIVANYKLDNTSVVFTVSEEEGKIFCPSFGDENKIYVYDLPTIKPAGEFSHFENNFYSIDLFPGYKLSQVSKEDGADKISERNGCQWNVNYFTQTRDKNGKGAYNLEAMSISMSDSLGSHKTASNAEIIAQTNFSINGISVTANTNECKFLDPKNNETVLYSSEYTFSLAGKEVQISLSSMENNLQKYEPVIKYMIGSMKIK